MLIFFFFYFSICLYMVVQKKVYDLVCSLHLIKNRVWSPGIPPTFNDIRLNFGFYWYFNQSSCIHIGFQTHCADSYCAHQVRVQLLSCRDGGDCDGCYDGNNHFYGHMHSHDVHVHDDRFHDVHSLDVHALS